MLMKVMIIEDEPLAAERLAYMLQQYDREIEISGKAESIEEALALLKEDAHFDLLFADVELRDGQSFALFEKHAIDLPVIFVTAYDQYALNAFKANSIDYLLKPVKKADLEQSILKFKKLNLSGKQDGLFNKSTRPSLEKPIQQRFLSKTGTKLVSVPVAQIAYFYTKDRYQYIKTAANEDYIIDMRLDDIECRLDAARFFRANRQFIINYECIHKVHAWFNGKLKVQVDPIAYEDVIVSRLRSTEFKKWLGE
jgi:DNA-binding LytR/AlgR family response regulator